MSICSNKEKENRILPISKIAYSNPDVIIKLLNKYKITGCSFPDMGYCDLTKCDFQNVSNPNLISETCSCNFLTLLANIEIGIIDSMNCFILKKNTFVAGTSKQDINVSIYARGDIKDLGVKTKQFANVQLVNLDSTDIKKSLVDISYDAIVNILDQAQHDDEGIMADEVSQQIIQLFYAYLDTNPDDMKENIKKGVDQSTTEITQRSVVGSITIQSVNVEIEAYSIESLNININLDQAIKIISKNITNVVLKNVLQQQLESEIDKVIINAKKQYCKGFNRKGPNIIYVSSGIIFFIFGLLVIIIFLYKKKKQRQERNRLQQQRNRLLQQKNRNNSNRYY